ncbi:hypothetical protein AB0E08_46690 [Streptomyces sp. NPDC048281]|uniref:hypothetical protein n=1 Tax=Streptomyces sp. NPDC048281 TaxID=3154715 RepID=UPI003431CDEC
MFTKLSHQAKNSPELDTQRSSVSFEVTIREDGSALLDGGLLHVSDGRPVHIAVLDALQDNARTHGGPVVAVIRDSHEGGTTRLEVTPDGSSRILSHAEEAEQTPAPPPADLHAAPVSAAPPSATEPVFEDLFQDPDPSPSPPPGTDPVPVPDELTQLVRLVQQSVDAGALERASAIAFRLREHSARSFGADHPYTLEAVSLEAFVAYRGGNHRLATTACLELARFRNLRSEPRAREDLMRAVAAWWLVDDVSFALLHGGAILDLWSETGQQGEPTAEDVELMSRVNRRINRLSAPSVTPEAGVA